MTKSLEQSGVCPSCIPEIEYTCQNHREKNQCAGCNKKNQKLRLCAFGEFCYKCGLQKEDTQVVDRGDSIIRMCKECLGL